MDVAKDAKFIADHLIQQLNVAPLHISSTV